MKIFVDGLCHCNCVCLSVFQYVVHIQQPLKPGISFCSVIVLLGQLNYKFFKSCKKSEEICVVKLVGVFTILILLFCIHLTSCIHTIILTAVVMTILLFEVAKLDYYFDLLVIWLLPCEYIQILK